MFQNDPLILHLLSVLVLHIAQHSASYHIQYHSVCRITDFVIQAACAVAVPKNCIRAVCHIANLSQTFQFNLNCLAVILVIRFLYQMHRNTGFQEILPVVMVCTCNGKVGSFHSCSPCILHFLQKFLQIPELFLKQYHPQ